MKKESPVKIEISNVSKEPEEKKNEEKPKKRRGRPPKNSGKAEEKSPESSNSTDGKRRSARRNLALVRFPLFLLYKGVLVPGREEKGCR